MLRKITRWLTFGLGGLVVLIALAAAAVYVVSSQRLNRTYAVTPPPVVIPSDPETVERGRHLAVAIAKCGDCHGERLEGKVFIDAPPFRVVGPNLTPGQGGIGAALTDADWVRAIRHGIARNGTALPVMPSDEYARLTEADLAAIIA
jgi:mono/diheme cytochrome c family protein